MERVEKKNRWFTLDFLISPVWGMTWNGIWMFYESIMFLVHYQTNAGFYRLLVDVIFFSVFAVFYAIAFRNFRK